MVLVIVKIVTSVDMEELLSGTFLGSSSAGLFTEAFSAAQVDWIINNLFLWWVNIFLAFFSSILLLLGFFALAILLPLGVDIFSGGNPIAVEAMPIGFLFMVCWGIFPLSYLLRSSWINLLKRVTNKFSSSN